LLNRWMARDRNSATIVFTSTWRSRPDPPPQQTLTSLRDRLKSFRGTDTPTD